MVNPPAYIVAMAPPDVALVLSSNVLRSKVVSLMEVRQMPPPTSIVDWLFAKWASVKRSWA